METSIRQWEARGQVLKQGQRVCGIQGTERNHVAGTDIRAPEHGWVL